MKFLVDNNLSPAVAAGLTDAGHEATHVRDAELATAPDTVVLAHARSQHRVLISADTDFGALLATSGETSPSVLMVRRLSGRRSEQIVAAVLANLDQVADELTTGAIVVLGEDWIRVRQLPIIPR